METIHIDASDAFDNAIKRGMLSDNPTNDHYAGNYMYMHSTDMGKGVRRDSFKNVNTRAYRHAWARI